MIDILHIPTKDHLANGCLWPEGSTDDYVYSLCGLTKGIFNADYRRGPRHNTTPTRECRGYVIDYSRINCEACTFARMKDLA